MGNLPYADTRTLTPRQQDCTGSNESEMYDTPPSADLNASVEYREHLARVLEAL